MISALSHASDRIAERAPDLLLVSDILRFPTIDDEPRDLLVVETRRREPLRDVLDQPLRWICPGEGCMVGRNKPREALRPHRLKLVAGVLQNPVHSLARIEGRRE